MGSARRHRSCVPARSLSSSTASPGRTGAAARTDMVPAPTCTHGIAAPPSRARSSSTPAVSRPRRWGSRGGRRAVQNRVLSPDVLRQPQRRRAKRVFVPGAVRALPPTTQHHGRGLTTARRPAHFSARRCVVYSSARASHSTRATCSSSTARTSASGSASSRRGIAALSRPGSHVCEGGRRSRVAVTC